MRSRERGNVKDAVLEDAFSDLQHSLQVAISLLTHRFSNAGKTPETAQREAASQA